MSRLPQELVDDIISRIYHHDTSTLRACSLVCSQWSARSRKSLFTAVQLGSQSELELWCARIRPGASGPSSLVEDLSLVDCHLSMSTPYAPKAGWDFSGGWTQPSAAWIQPSNLSKATRHFQSFTGLQALEIVGWDTFVDQVPLMLHCFGPHSDKVTRLTLSRIFIHQSALVTLIGHFPNLNYLSVSDLRPHWREDGTGESHGKSYGSIVPTHPCGEFSVLTTRIDEPENLFRGIALLEPRFRRVILRSQYRMWRDFWPLMETCAGFLEELELSTGSTGE